MAYWTECPSCKQLSVSASPLARLNDKACPYCGRELQEETESEIQEVNKVKEEKE